MSRDEDLQRIGSHIAEYARTFMFDPTFYAGSVSHGFSGLDFYVTGRGGVLGNVSGRVVSSIFGFMDADFIIALWEQGTAACDPTTAGQLFAVGCEEWSEAKLGHLDIDIDRANDLIDRVVVTADPAGRPLFEAWREQPLPDGGAARLGRQLQTLREHRGATHLMTMTAAGIPPQAAAVLYQGDVYAEIIGFSAPHPDPEPFREPVAAAQVTTDRLAALPFEILNDDEVAELRVILDAVHDAIT